MISFVSLLALIWRAAHHNRVSFFGWAARSTIVKQNICVSVFKVFTCFSLSHLCECLCLCGNTGILIMWLLCVSACLSMEKLPLIGLGVSESRIMNQNPVKHWNSTEVHCGYIELGELGLLHCTCALLNSVHWFSLNLNTVHTGERNLSNIAKCAQCTKYLHNMPALPTE